ncbi:hypothetical protein U1Q18_018110 [Sarracenia purpurea var. burkii]
MVSATTPCGECLRAFGLVLWKIEMGSANRFSVVEGGDEDFLDSVKGTSSRAVKVYSDLLNKIGNNSLDAANGKQAQSGPNPFNSAKMATLETRIQRLKGFSPIKMGPLKLSRADLISLTEKETNKLSGAKKKVDESKCNKEGVSEEEDIEEGTSEDDEEDSKEGESEDECVVEEKTRMNIGNKVKCSDSGTPEPNLSQISAVNCLLIGMLKCGRWWGIPICTHGEGPQEGRGAQVMPSWLNRPGHPFLLTRVCQASSWSKHEFKPGNVFIRYCECFASGIYCD